MKESTLMVVENSLKFLNFNFAQSEKHGSKIITRLCYNVKIEYNFIYKNILSYQKYYESGRGLCYDSYLNKLIY